MKLRPFSSFKAKLVTNHIYFSVISICILAVLRSGPYDFTGTLSHEARQVFLSALVSEGRVWPTCPSIFYYPNFLFTLEVISSIRDMLKLLIIVSSCRAC